MNQPKTIRKSAVALVSLALSLVISGLISNPAQAATPAPGNGYYGCETGDLESLTLVPGARRFQISGGVVVRAIGCDGAVVVPDGVTDIGDGSFDSSLLTSISIPESVTRIGQTAFYGTTRLTSISLPSSVTTIGDRAFSNASSLASITLPVGLTAIGTSAFEVTALTSITIPEGVTSLPSFVFSNSSALTSVSIPSSLTSIDKNSFDGASALTSITVASNNQSYSSIDGVLFSKDAEVLLDYPLGKSATSYNIPEGVTSIGDSAFAAAASLTSITIPASVTSIDNYAFAEATSLASINIPEGIPTIGEYAFTRTALTTINIPSSVTSIGYGAFEDTITLKDINFLGNAPFVDEYAFFGVASGAIAHISANATGFGTESTWKGLEIDRSVSVPTYTVSYNTAGGSSVNADSFTTGGTIQSAPVSTRVGYTLSGWSTTSNGTIVTFPFAPGVTNDIILFAIWTPLEVATYTPATNTPATNTPAVVVYSPTISVGGKLTAKSIATGLAIATPKKSKTTLVISKSSKKYCKVKSGKIVGVKKGPCLATVTVQAPKPKKGKKPAPVKKSVTVQIF